MTKNELLEKISKTPELKGAVIDDCTRETRDYGIAGTIIVGSFSMTPDWKKAKEVLSEMGFRVSTGAADIRIKNDVVEKIDSPWGN